MSDIFTHAPRLNTSQMTAITRSGHRLYISGKSYTLPFVPLIDISAGNRVCVLCGNSFTIRDVSEGPKEYPAALPCGHVFGSECLKLWLGTGSSCYECDFDFGRISDVRALPLTEDQLLVAGAGLLPDPGHGQQWQWPILTRAPEDGKVTDDDATISDASSEGPYLAEDVEAALALMGMRGDSSGLGFQSEDINMPQTTDDMEAALARFNGHYGTSMSLEDLKVALRFVETIRQQS